MSGKIYYIMGKSASGKDTIYKNLIQDRHLALKPVIPYTTRPVRQGETDGVEYFFCSEEQLRDFEKACRIIELRSYDTVHGIWKYFTVNDRQFENRTQNLIAIGTLESYMEFRIYFGNDRVIPVYIEVEDGDRLQRAIDRERMQENPKYAELCRRFLADAGDFSEEKLKAAGITRRFVNRDIEETVQEIREFIRISSSV